MDNCLTLKSATTLIDSVIAKVETPVSIAIVDAGGHLLALKRMDGASVASAELCRVKAETACIFNTASKDLAEASILAPALSRPVALFGGGVPIRKGGELLGAIGVAGGHPDQDHALAAGVTLP